MDIALELEHLAKTYKSGRKALERKAVVDISLTVPVGTVFGLLGPNGAGKTTTIKMAMGFVRPDSGRVAIFGEPDSAKMRRRIGFLPEQPYFYPYLTAQSALDFYAKLFGIKRAQRVERSKRLLDTVGLGDVIGLPLNKFSKGMLQRFGIAQALINDPDLLIFDEPASGLDPIGQVEIREILTSLNSQGKSILLSSHYLSEVQNLCHEVAFVNKGSVIARGKIDDLLDVGDVYTISVSSLSDDRRPSDGIIEAQRENGLLRMTVKRDNLEQTIDAVRLSGGFIENIGKTTKSLEELFLELVGGGVGGR